MSQVELQERATQYERTDDAVARSVLRIIVVGILASTAASAWSQELAEKSPLQSVVQEAPVEYVLDIPGQPLDQALKEFCRLTGLLYGQMPETREEQTFTTARLKGKFTADEALKRLLDGSGLVFEWIGPNQFSVGRRPVVTIPKNGVGVNTVPPAGSDQTRSKIRQRPEADAGATGGRSGSSAQSREEMEEVKVTGTRLWRGAGDGGDGPIPVMVLDRDDIDRSGASTVGDLLKYLPQQPYTRTDGFQTSGAQYAEMRGIGFDTTAIQINGRRLVPSASSLTNNAFDLNTIPLVAVKRIEVLPDSASAVYGADAIGGVVNIILWDKIPEPVLELNYGQARGGGAEHRASLSAGYSKNQLKATLVLDYTDRDFLLGDERDRWRNQDYRRFGGADQRSLNTNPGNISALLPMPLPGLSSRFAAVPAGSTGIGLTPADFLATQGTRNRESLYEYFTIVPETERYSAVASAEVKLEPGLKAFGEFLYVNRKSAYQVDPPSVINGIVPATNPFNPFHVPVLANFLLRDLGPREFLVDSDLFRGVAGMQGGLGSMTWELSVLRTAEGSSVVTTNTVDPARVKAALEESLDPAKALNVFQDGPGGSPELLASLRAPPLQSKYSSESAQASGYLSGPLFSLPTGPVDTVLGGEWRRESVLFDEAQLTSKASGSHHRLITAAFTEARVPLVSPDANRPMLKDLVLTAAARLDDYNDFGSTFNPRYGLIWHPINSLALRASYGTSFRPPSMLELFAPNLTVAVPNPDPRRNNETVVVQVKTGGNAELKPVKADSLTAGLIFQPATFYDLKLTGTYWQIHMRDRITIVPPSSLLLNEALFPERVVRNAPTPADVTAGLPGTLAFLDVSRMNFGRLQTSGVDLGASLALNTSYGRYTPSVKATWVRDFTSQDLPSTAPVERVGVAASPLGTIARWRVVATLSWEYSGLTLSTAARYVPRYADAGFAGPNGRIIPSQTIVDAQASFDLGQLFGLGWRGLTLATGMNNLFDEEPNFAEVAGPIGFDQSQGDLKQRYGYVVVSKKF